MITLDDEFMVADVPGYEGLYKVTSSGQIFSLRKGIFLKLGDSGTGYKFVFLNKDNITEKVYVHRLVAEVFCPKENESYNEVHHIDGNRSNNAAHNLMWVDKIEHRKTHKERAIEQYDLISGNTIAEYESGKDAAAATGITRSGISLCCNGKQKTAGGFGWRFKENKENNDNV